MLEYGRIHYDWLIEKFSGLTEKIVQVSPSQWAEENRYLSESVSRIPGYFSYEVTPALREIADCMDVRSPVREVDVMKASQVGVTVGVLETTIGYIMKYVSTAPAMMVTANDNLAKTRLGKYILPMIRDSNLEHLIQSSDTNNSRKTGKRSDSLEWAGGGFLIPVGANSANNFRSISIWFLLLDECDGFPVNVGKQGDIDGLVESRVRAYYEKRKILRLSTPLIKGRSRIEKEFNLGDKRYYYVPCKSCGQKQRLKFQGKDDVTGKKYGLVWEAKGQNLNINSVRYLCKFCGHPHYNSDKSWLFKRGQWRPTAESISPEKRSYHLSALYSPASMYPWSAMVSAYLKAWDVEKNQPRDLEKLQVFYNNDLGMPFELVGNKIKFVSVSGHRRHDYFYGDIPNTHAEKYTGGKILLLTAAVDVHKSNLAVGIFGWTRGARAYLIDYFTFEGNAESLDDPDTWLKLQDLIDNKIYKTEDCEYRIMTTFIDASYNNELVVSFCSQYVTSVFPVLGRAAPSKNQAIKEYTGFKTKAGTQGYIITVDIYKDRWASALRKIWDGRGEQPGGHFNAPMDVSDKALKELTVEYKREKVEKTTGKRVGWEWHRPNNADNELWDLLIYNNAALEIIAYDICINALELEAINFEIFWDKCEQENLFFSLKKV